MSVEEEILNILILIVLILLSAFFSSCETAFTMANTIQLEILEKDGNKGAGRAIKILSSRGEMLSAILIGNNVVNLSASALSTAITIRLFGSLYIGLFTGILTVIILIIGEIIPKSLASVFPVRFAVIYSLPVFFLMRILKPLNFFLDAIRKLSLRLFGLKDGEKPDKMTEEELKSLMDLGLSEGAIENDEFKMISNVFELDDSLARSVMIPLPDIISLRVNYTYEEVLKIYREYNYTRYPVYSNDGTTVVGTFNIKDLLTDTEGDFSVGRLMREPHFTFEHKNILSLLVEMREKAVGIMTVLDEYGQMSGIITLEDILEEIVGEIRDEYDSDERDNIIEIREGEYLLDGQTSLQDVNERLGISLSSSSYDTLGGLMIETLDRLPKKGETIMIGDISLTAEIVRKNRVEKVHLEKK